MVSTHRRAVGIFSSRTQTASALQALSDSGFSMGDVSVIAKDADRQNDIAGVTVKNEVTNQADTGGAIGAATGGVLGGVTGLLVGLGTLTIPGLGPALLAGEAAVVLSTLVGGAAGAAAGGLVGALVGLGIPEHRAARYQDRVAQGDYLVMVKGTAEEIARAERTLGSAGIEDWGVYPMADGPEPNDRRNGEGHNGRRSEGAIAPSANGTRNDWSGQGGRDRTLHQSSSPHPSSPPSQFPEADEQYDVSGLPHSSNPLRASGTAVADMPSAARPGLASGEERRVLGVFLKQQHMEDALAQLQQNGFPLHTLSIAVREADAPAPDQQPAYGGHSLAGATRLTAGLHRMLLPEVGTVLVMGPDADALSGTFLPYGQRQDGSKADNLGIAPESAHLYRRHLTDGAYLITLRGSNQDMLQAASTLGQWGMHDWGIYDVHRR